MWFGLPAEVAVRCEHCGENDWRTPVELKSGRLVCFMCNGVSFLAPAVVAPAARLDAAVGLFEIARRLASLQSLPGVSARQEDERAAEALPLIDPEPAR